MMLSLNKALRVQLDERFESDRDSLPFPRGGVFGQHAHADASPSTQNGAPTQPEFAAHLLQTIDHVQANIDALERQLHDERLHDFRQLADVVGRISAQPNDDWRPPAA